jgi:hypothetical protein
MMYFHFQCIYFIKYTEGFIDHFMMFYVNSCVAISSECTVIHLLTYKVSAAAEPVS